LTCSLACGPFPWYTRLSDEDVQAIKAYLFSLEPVNAPRKPTATSLLPLWQAPQWPGPPTR
jgi:hypothetical protein